MLYILGRSKAHGAYVPCCPFKDHLLDAQALSKRIHYGKFVAEAKFLAQTEKYSSLIRQQDAGGLMKLLTDEAVEAKVCRGCGPVLVQAILPGTRHKMLAPHSRRSM